MQFNKTWELVLEGKKTQTSRLVKPGDVGIITRFDVSYLNVTPGGSLSLVGTQTIGEVRNKNGNLRFKVGQVLSVQPGRGKAAIWWNPITGWPIENAVIWNPQYTMDWEVAEEMTRVDRRKSLKAKGYVPLQIRVLRIRRQDVRAKSHEDSLAEGFESREHFWHTFVKLNDKTLHNKITKQYPSWIDNNVFSRMLNARTRKFYDAWVLDFERVIP